MRFAAAPEYQVFPTREVPLKPYAAAVKASASTRELIRAFDPDVVVADIITVAGSLAAQAEGRPWATLVPHVLPTGEPGFPIYSVGAVYPRSAIGRRMWSLVRPIVMTGEEQGRVELNGARERVGLGPLDEVHGGISRDLAIVATFPQLEYPRTAGWPGIRITGPLLWEQPFGDVELPPGDDPLVLVAPSTSQDPEHRLVRGALEALADEPVRVLASTNRREPAEPLPVPANARVVDWVSYARTMPRLRRGGLPRRPRHARACAGKRSAGGGVPPRRGHGRERRPHPLGGGGRVAAAPPHDATRHPARGPPRARRAALPAPCRGAARLGGPQRRGQRGRRRSRRVRRISQNSAKSGLIALGGLTQDPDRWSTHSRDADGAQRAKP